MQERHLIGLGALNMLIAIAAGAFGAHALKQILSLDLLAIWQTAAQYQAMHGLGLLVLGSIMNHFDAQKIARCGMLMLLGILLFSGSLYLLALTGMRQLGAVTPLGGLAFLSAWAYLILLAFKENAK
jgi:uncharacterized membrane protein YgdD (TMEM256/DUF423 family)